MNNIFANFKHWINSIINCENKKNIIDNNPWAGLHSYEDPDKSDKKLVFKGRDREIADFQHLIESCQVITLYGRSGIGKTSLLKAGLFPVVREKSMVPVYIRPGAVGTQ